MATMWAWFSVVAQFEFHDSSERRHPERSRFSGGERDLRHTKSSRGRSLSQLKCAGFRDDAGHDRYPRTQPEPLPAARQESLSRPKVEKPLTNTGPTPPQG